MQKSLFYPAGGYRILVKMMGHFLHPPVDYESWLTVSNTYIEHRTQTFVTSGNDVEYFPSSFD